MKTRYLMVLLWMVTSPFASGQNLHLIDSLVTELSEQKSDSSRCRLMQEIAAQYLTTDSSVAIDFLDRSREIGERLEIKNCLGHNYDLRGEMHTHFGNYKQALVEFDRAMAYYAESDNDMDYYEVMKDKGNVHLYMSEYGQAMEYYETALDYYRRNNLPEGASKCLNNMGIIYKNRGQYVEALSVFEESIKLIDEDKEPMQVARGYINMGNVFVYLGRYERALDYYLQAIIEAEKEGNIKEYALCLLNTGVVQNKCGNYREADNMYRRALSMGRQLGDPILISNCQINIGTNYSEMDRLKEALEYVEKGLAMKTELGDDRAISNCQIYLAEIYFKMQDLPMATELFNRAIPAKEALGDREGLVRGYLGLAQVYFEQGKYQEAGRNTDRAIVLAQEINALEHISTGYRIKQEIAAIKGDYRSAYQYALDQSQVNDSLMGKSTSNAVMEMEFRYRSNTLEKENENLRIQTSLNAEIMKKQNAFLYAMVGIAILMATLLILGIYFFRRLRQSSLKLEEKNLVITRQNIKLDNLNRTKDRMMSIIAHDLRGTIGNQLTAIEVMHHLEDGEQNGIDFKGLLGNLKHSASYSLELLENLLLWSRLDENKSFFHPETVDLARIVHNCISLFDETAKNKDVSVTQDIREGITIMADKIMLETIIRNLVSNSIKFSRQGGDISVAAEESRSEIKIRVTDRGVGMSKEQIDKVMNNGGFTRRGTSNEKGAGIGMTLVREFTAIHRGKLVIDSKEDEGTTVTLTFPKRD
jgi:signal transduction histidine kinase/Tfp pilus assembly protein PilF